MPAKANARSTRETGRCALVTFCRATNAVLVLTDALLDSIPLCGSDGSGSDLYDRL